jgi:two-component system chemotaxis response regulator CheB
MGDIIFEKTRNGTPDPQPVPKEVVVEADISERVAIGITNVMQLGVKSLFSCPDCGGGLWEIKEEGLTRFRCHTGHTYTAADLMFRQQEELERTIWIALRILEERRMLLEKISDEEDDKGWTRMAAVKKQRAKEMEEHIERLKSFLFDSKLN